MSHRGDAFDAPPVDPSVRRGRYTDTARVETSSGECPAASAKIVARKPFPPGCTHVPQTACDAVFRETTMGRGKHRIRPSHGPRSGQSLAGRGFASFSANGVAPTLSVPIPAFVTRISAPESST